MYWNLNIKRINEIILDRVKIVGVNSNVCYIGRNVCYQNNNKVASTKSEFT